jgi:hypothetical protein
VKRCREGFQRVEVSRSGRLAARASPHPTRGSCGYFDPTYSPRPCKPISPFRQTSRLAAKPPLKKVKANEKRPGASGVPTAAKTTVRIESCKHGCESERLREAENLSRPKKKGTEPIQYQYGQSRFGYSRQVGLHPHHLGMLRYMLQYRRRWVSRQEETGREKQDREEDRRKGLRESPGCRRAPFTVGLLRVSSSSPSTHLPPSSMFQLARPLRTGTISLPELIPMRSRRQDELTTVSPCSPEQLRAGRSAPPVQHLRSRFTTRRSQIFASLSTPRSSARASRASPSRRAELALRFILSRSG